MSVREFKWICDDCGFQWHKRLTLSYTMRWNTSD